MPADLVLVIIFVAAILLGVVRGPVRQALALGAWLVAFIVAAFVRAPVSEWVMGQFPAVSDRHAQMVSFLLVFLVLFAIALVVIQATGITVQLIARPYVDEILGGALMLLVAILAVSSVLIALDTYYASAISGEPQVGFVNDLHDALAGSGVAHALRVTVSPAVLAVLSPLLPADVRAPG